MRRSALILPAFAWMAAACGARAATPTTPHEVKTIQLEPLRVDVGPGGAKAYDASSLLDEGNDALMQRKYDDALAAYDHLIADFADSKLVLPALFNAGLALEGKREWSAAAERYRRAIPIAPTGSKDLLDLRFHLAAVLSELEQYPESIANLQKILEQTELSPERRLEALARLGYGIYANKDTTGGEEALRSALAYYREIQGTTHLESKYFAAMAQYYLAEIPHQRFVTIPLRYPEEQMVKDMDQKSELLLLARDRYVQTADFKDPYWATAAIFQIGAMYKEFWDNWMAVPIPAGFDEAEAKEYVKQVNEEPQLKKLLEKALLFHERNLTIMRTDNIRTTWTEQSEKEADLIRSVLARQARKDYIQPGPQQPASAARQPQM